MLIKLTGGKIYDPTNGVDGVVRDIYVENGRIVTPQPGAKVSSEYALNGKVVMAGGIDRSKWVARRAARVAPTAG